MKGEIKQRSPGSWEIRVFLGRDEHGKRIRKNETVRGKKADAERRLREILSELDRGIVPSVQRYKLAQWLELWLADVVAQTTERKTFDRYEGVVRIHLVPNLGSVEISKITPRQVQELESRLLRDGMAPKGVQMVHNVFNGAMKHALKMELIFRNPVAAVSPPTAPKTEAPTPTLEQVRALLAVAASSGHYLWVCIYLIVFTGLRRGEALGLRWACLNLDARTLQVETSLVTTKPGLILKSPKTHSGRRTVNLDNLTVTVLREHQKRQKELAEQLRVDLPEMVFPRLGLEGWCHPNTLVNYIERVAQQARCPGVTLRSLRHFHASMALQERQNPKTVAERIGHSNASTTMNIYGHVLPGWQQEMAEAVAKAINTDS